MDEDGQLTIFDQLEAARAGRDAAIQRVDDHADPEWKDLAFDALVKCAMMHETLTAYDIWHYVDKPLEPRANGPLMLRGKREGIIAPTEEFRQTGGTVRHAGPARVWKSLVFHE